LASKGYIQENKSKLEENVIKEFQEKPTQKGGNKKKDTQQSENSVNNPFF
jgi:hypothetical protein